MKIKEVKMADDKEASSVEKLNVVERLFSMAILGGVAVAFVYAFYAIL